MSPVDDYQNYWNLYESEAQRNLLYQQSLFEQRYRQADLGAAIRRAQEGKQLSKDEARRLRWYIQFWNHGDGTNVGGGYRSGPPYTEGPFGGDPFDNPLHRQGLR